MKGVLKVTKEQVLEVEHYCNEHGVTRKQRISELGLSITSYYYTRGLLTDDELREGHFLSLSAGSGQRSMSQTGKKSGRAGNQPESITIELRLPSGTEMRVMGNFSPEMLRVIMGNV